MMFKNASQLFATVAVLAIAGLAQAAVVTRWNFNSPVDDAILSTGTTNPSVGAGTIQTLGGVTATFASGLSNGVSSDVGVTDNSAWNTTTYPAQGTGDKTAGIRANVSTVGFDTITISYDLRHSNTSSRYEAVQYTIDGSNWIDAMVFDGNAGDTWFKNRVVDLSAVSGVSNNPNFAFRVVSTFAPDSSSYAPSNSGSNYAGTGTWRFDMVTISGSPAVIPEPAALGLLAPAAMLLGRRRK